MKLQIFSFILSVALILLIAGCKASPVYNVEGATFMAPPSASLGDIQRAIIRAGKRSGWRIRPVAPGVLSGAYSYKKNKYGAIVRINYGRDSYDITYHNSHGLKYNERIANENDAPDFFQDSKDFFAESFGDGEDFSTPAEKPATIHKIYNRWVSKLETAINSEIASLGTHKLGRSTTASAPSYSHRSSGGSRASKCQQDGVYNKSGQGSVKRSSVNVRSGPSTRCSIIGSVRNHESFELLGQENKWYFIKLNNGNNGWIYAPLVSTGSTGTQVASRAGTTKSSTSPPPPPPPAKPKIKPKNISIAVIRFKTLNKEAQKIALGELVSETFTSALVNSNNFKIIEREQLDKVVKEMEMSQTGFIETTDAVQIGKMLHADAIITGSVALLNNQIQMNARIIEIKSAYVISADTRTTTYTLKNINDIAHEIVSKLARKLAGY